MTETALSRRIREHANALPATRALKLAGGPMMERGTPDLLVVREGRAIFLEVKVGKNKPSKLQERRLEQWKAAGAIAITVWTFEEAVAALRTATERDDGLGGTDPHDISSGPDGHRSGLSGERSET